MASGSATPSGGSSPTAAANAATGEQQQPGGISESSSRAGPSQKEKRKLERLDDETKLASAIIAAYSKFPLKAKTLSLSASSEPVLYSNESPGQLSPPSSLQGRPRSHAQGRTERWDVEESWPRAQSYENSRNTSSHKSGPVPPENSFAVHQRLVSSAGQPSAASRDLIFAGMPIACADPSRDEHQAEAHPDFWQQSSHAAPSSSSAPGHWMP